MTKILQISPTHAGGNDAWQVEMDDMCVCVCATQAGALAYAERMARVLDRTGELCEVVLTHEARPVRIAA